MACVPRSLVAAWGGNVYIAQNGLINGDPQRLVSARTIA
jgi:hypothetical protein